MTTIGTAKAPSLFKAALLFAATAAMLAISSRAPAQEVSPAPRAYAGEPMVRIRGVNSHGLSPIGLADWLVAHGHHVSRSAELFVRADVDRNGRVTAIELKDLMISLG